MLYEVITDEQEAEDAAQETFLQIYNSLSEYREQGFKTWLTRIALHKAIDLKRKRERRREQQGDVIELASRMPVQSEHILQGLLVEEQRDELRQKIKQLPDGHQTVITSYSIHYTKLYESFARFRSSSIRTDLQKWIRQS